MMLGTEFWIARDILEGTLVCIYLLVLRIRNCEFGVRSEETR